VLSVEHETKITRKPDCCTTAQGLGYARARSACMVVRNAVFYLGVLFGLGFYFCCNETNKTNAPIAAFELSPRWFEGGN